MLKTMYDNHNQNTLEWYRRRLGNITGSAVGNIMGKPKGKNDEWTATAQTYLNQIAFERAMNPLVVENDDLFAQYVTLTSARSKAIDWGHQMEGEAAHLFAMSYIEDGTHYELELEEPSSVKCEDLPHFASSPDRVFYSPVTGEMCCIEIKCPQSAAFAKFVKNVFTLTDVGEQLEGLKKVDANYFWQCFAHMLATGASRTYFVVYNPFQLRPLNVIRIERDEAIISQLRERIVAADKYVTQLTEELVRGQLKTA